MLCGNRPVCDTCGHRLENGPLTPDETPPVVDNEVPHVHTRIPSSANTSCVVQGLTCDIDSNMSDYDSGASDMTTISIPSINPSPDSIALAAQNAVLKAEIRQLQQKIIDTTRVAPHPTVMLTH